MKHTKGPWKRQVWNGIHQAVVDAERKTVAFDISTKTNADLIAAAPELLAVCRVVIEQASVFDGYHTFVCQYCGQYHSTKRKVDHNVDCLAFLAQNAIDKATGS
jgi:hypothetical protein